MTLPQKMTRHLTQQNSVETKWDHMTRDKHKMHCDNTQNHLFVVTSTSLNQAAMNTQSIFQAGTPTWEARSHKRGTFQENLGCRKGMRCHDFQTLMDDLKGLWFVQKKRFSWGTPTEMLEMPHESIHARPQNSGAVRRATMLKHVSEICDSCALVGVYEKLQ